MEDQHIAGADLRLFTWIAASELPSPDESNSDSHSMLLAIEGVGVVSGFYSEKDNLFNMHCQRYDSFDDEPVEGWTREQEINNNLDWQTQEVYPDEHPEAVWGNTVTHWMLIPAPPVIDDLK